MSGRKQSEPFTEFAERGRGIPVLTYRRNRNQKTAHVEWHDGSMRDSRKFYAALDKDGMSREIHEAWHRHLQSCNRRTTLCGGGGTSGGLFYAPHVMADEIREIVRRYFTQALEQMFETKMPDTRKYLEGVSGS